MSFSFLLRVELKWFLMWLSVLPGRSFAISDHLFPSFLWASMISMSSSSVHLFFFMLGFKWLCHLKRVSTKILYLSLHCFPIRPGRAEAIWLQFWAPCLLTIVTKVWSSSSVQGPLIIAGLSTFCHLCRHCTSVRLSKNEAILFQFFAYINSYDILASK